MNWVIIILLVLIAGVREIGYIKGKPVLREEDRVKIVGRVEGVKGFDYVVVDGIWIKVSADKEVEWGDNVSVFGSISCRLPEENSGCFFLNTDQIHVIRSQNGIRQWMYQVRLRLISKVLRWIPGDEGALMAGILLGGNDLMTKDGSMAFSRAGLSHIVAASGFNVTMVSGWVGVLFLRLMGRRRMLPFVILSIIMYMFLAGLGAPVIRAGLMAIMVLVGTAMGRKSEWGWILALVSLGSLVIYPKWLWEISWQLSVAATVGLMLLSGGEQKAIFIWNDIKTTLAVYVTTLPIILAQFGTVSVVAPLTNALVLWSVPLGMQIGALALAVGLLNDSLGRLVMYLTWPLLKWALTITTWFSGMQWVMIDGVKIGWLWVWAYYVTLVLGWLWWHRYRKYEV